MKSHIVMLKLSASATALAWAMDETAGKSVARAKALCRAIREHYERTPVKTRQQAAGNRQQEAA